eukprot:GHVU01217103.1.p1 GENE.GHVU01217103.1~~GHVU01217103.1.p1  ORF type:complete len:574 (+),score=19.98 GHVU01217103.1:218-1723(+)
MVNTIRLKTELPDSSAGEECGVCKRYMTCHEKLWNPVPEDSVCNHWFHEQCLLKDAVSHICARCPYCRKEYDCVRLLNGEEISLSSYISNVAGVVSLTRGNNDSEYVSAARCAHTSSIRTRAQRIVEDTRRHTIPDEIELDLIRSPMEGHLCNITSSIQCRSEQGGSSRSSTRTDDIRNTDAVTVRSSVLRTASQTKCSDTPVLSDKVAADDGGHDRGDAMMHNEFQNVDPHDLPRNPIDIPSILPADVARIIDAFTGVRRRRCDSLGVYENRVQTHGRVNLYIRVMPTVKGNGGGINIPFACWSSRAAAIEVVDAAVEILRRLHGYEVAMRLRKPDVTETWMTELSSINPLLPCKRLAHTPDGHQHVTDDGVGVSSTDPHSVEYRDEPTHEDCTGTTMAGDGPRATAVYQHPHSDPIDDYQDNEEHVDTTSDDDKSYDFTDVTQYRQLDGEDLWKVSWKGYSDRHSTWEPTVNIVNPTRMTVEKMRKLKDAVHTISHSSM